MSADSAPQGPPGHGGFGGPGPMTPEKIKMMMSMTYKYKGIKFQSVVTPLSSMEAMETFPVRDDDIFIVTYPKCGTHWTMEMVYLILADGCPEKIDRKEKMEFGALEMNLPSQGGPPTPAYKHVETIKSRRVLPTHLPETIIPQAVLQNKGKVIYVTRNPKDCLTSYHRFVAKIAGSYKWEDSFEDFISNDAMNGNFFDFNLAYWKHRHDDNFLFLKYEDMKRDTRSTVIAIADHLGCVLTEEAVDRVVKNCSMDAMKKSYEKADQEGVMVTFAPKGKENLGKFLRKGVVGDWKNSFTVAQNERFDEVCNEKLKGSGLKFEFE